MRRMIGVLLLAWLAGASCSDSPPDSVEEIVETLRDNGVDCTNFRGDPVALPDDASNFAQCEYQGQRVEIAIFEDEEKRDQYVKESAVFGFLSLVGPNSLILTGDDNFVSDAKNALEEDIENLECKPEDLCKRFDI